MININELRRGNWVITKSIDEGFFSLDQACDMYGMTKEDYLTWFHK